MQIRRAKEKDMERIDQLLMQVCLVHHNGRPDLNVWCCNENAMKFYESCGLKPRKIGMETIL